MRFSRLLPHPAVRFFLIPSPYQMKIKNILFGFFVLALMAACGDKGSSLPKSSGLSGDMYVVMDSVQWRGELGKVLDSLFSQEMEGLPRGEPIFNMKYVDPRKLNFILKQRRNLIFAVTLDH